MCKWVLRAVLWLGETAYGVIFRSCATSFQLVPRSSVNFHLSGQPMFPVGLVGPLVTLDSFAVKCVPSSDAMPWSLARPRVTGVAFHEYADVGAYRSIKAGRTD